MKCDQIKELILTDYLDSQISSENKQAIEAHLLTCAKCREFLLAAEKTTQPFNKAEKVKTPEHIWQTIKSTIEEGKKPAASSLIIGFLRDLGSFIILPKPRLAIASAITIALLVAVIARQPFSNTIIVNDYLNEQVAFFDSLDNSIVNGNSEDYANFGTSIEEFFL